MPHAAVAASLAALHHLFGRRVPVRLGERDPVQCGVELPVAGSAEPVAGFVGRPDWHRRGAFVTGVGILGSEPIEPAGPLQSNTGITVDLILVHTGA
jgi:hypothetical protein